MSDYTRVTIDDVAQRAGVSTATVSRVVNRTGTVSAQTTARVLTAISELNYIPQAAARGLASRKTHILGLILDEIYGEFLQHLLRGVEMAVRESGFDLLISSVQATADSGTYAIGDHNTDGLLIYAYRLPDEKLKRLAEQHFPVVLLHRTPPPEIHIPTVTFANKSGARHLVDHLIETCGHRQIAFLSGPADIEDSYWREIGYRESLATHGIRFDPTLTGPGEFDEEVAWETVTEWIKQGIKPDAIFASDDEAALGAMIAIKEAGLEVPRDIAVAGFDDIRLARYLTPPLTTVRAPIEAAGRTGIEQLVHLIETGQADPLTLLPTELIIRRSCGRP